VILRGGATVEGSSYGTDRFDGPVATACSKNLGEVECLLACWSYWPMVDQFKAWVRQECWFGRVICVDRRLTHWGAVRKYSELSLKCLASLLENRVTCYSPLPRYMEGARPYASGRESGIGARAPFWRSWIQYQRHVERNLPWIRYPLRYLGR